MMRPVCSPVLGLLLCAAVPALAQSSVEFRLATGPLLDPVYPEGFHASASASVATPLRNTRLRAEALHTDDDFSSYLSTTASLVVDPFPHPLLPYAVIGGGVTLSQGLSPLLNLGLGWDLPARVTLGEEGRGRVLPLFLELRAHAGHASGVGLALGVRL